MSLIRYQNLLLLTAAQYINTFKICVGRQHASTLYTILITLTDNLERSTSKARARARKMDYRENRLEHLFCVCLFTLRVTRDHW